MTFLRPSGIGEWHAGRSSSNLYIHVLYKVLRSCNATSTGFQNKWHFYLSKTFSDLMVWSRSFGGSFLTIMLMVALRVKVKLHRLCFQNHSNPQRFIDNDTVKHYAIHPFHISSAGKIRASHAKLVLSWASFNDISGRKERLLLVHLDITFLRSSFHWLFSSSRVV